MKSKNGNYKHPKLANSILKYGWNNFKSEILYEVETLEEALELEASKIKEYNSFESGYNTSPGGKCVYDSSRSVDMINPDDESIIMTFESAVMASEYVGLKGNTNIIRCCKGSLKTAGSYNGERISWRYTSESSSEKESRLKLRKELEDKNTRKINTICSHAKTPVSMFYTNGEHIMDFDSIKEAADFIGFKNSTHISECCKGIRNSAGKFNNKKVVWCYKDKYFDKSSNIESRISKNIKRYQKIQNLQPNKKSIIGTSITDGSVIKFESLKEAANFLKLKNPTTITAVIKGRQKSTAGYTWRYDE